MKLLLALMFALAWAEPDFPPAKLADFDQVTGQGKGERTFDTASPGFTCRLNYTGKQRELSDEKKAFVGQVAKLFSKPELVSQYQKEVQVKEGKRLFWVAVQESFRPFLDQELKGKKRFDASIRFAGLLKKAPVFLMIGFKAL